VGVPEATDGNAAQRVEIAFPLAIEQVGAFAPVEADG